jgi:hypothetical protein
MPDFTSEVEVYVDEFWEACSQSEKDGLIDLIEEEGFVKRIANVKTNKQIYTSFMEQDHINFCNTISNSYIRMSVEELEIIKQLAKKYGI